MAPVVRCQGCTRTFDAQLIRSSGIELQDRRLAGQKHKAPPKYRSKTYEPLPKQRGYIRVLNVRGSSVENPLVECELMVINLSKEQDKSTDDNKRRHYEALSWCWGTAKHTAYVNIRKDGKVYGKYVPPELFAALKALRYPKEDRFLWIDTICIDQENPQEKNHQVEMIADIYGQADRVCVWLGEGDRSSQVALRFIRKEVLQLQNFDELCESELASEKWSALLDLMQRPWFSRRWVVQEVALARRAMVYCGNDRIAWKKFAVAVELFVEVETATHRLSEVMKKDPKFYHVPGWFEYVSALGASLLVDATGKLFRDYKPNGPLDAEMESGESDLESESDEDEEPASPATSDADSESEAEPDPNPPSDKAVSVKKGQPLLSLEYLVSSLSIFDVTVPHDAVYALLAIARDTIPSAGNESARSLLGYTKEALEEFTQKKRYNVNYAQPFSDVCKEFVHFCIDQSEKTRALDIICRPWAPEVVTSAPTRAPVGTKNNWSRTASGSSEKARLVTEKTEEKSKKDSQKTGDRKASKGGEKNMDNTQSHKSKQQHKPKAEFSPWKKVKDPIPLPSWIPQLTGAAYAMLPQAGVHTLKMGRKNADTLVGLPSSTQSLQRNYNAAETRGIDRKTFRFQKRPTMKHHSMYVKGFVLDTIVELQPSSQGGAIPSGWARAGGWRNVPLSDPPDDFWRTLVADRGRDGRNPPVYYSRACKESFVKGGLSSGSVNTTDLINNERCSVVAQFCRRVQAVIWNRCLIKTQTGRLGLAGQYAQLEDVICILYGCSVPVVLRRKWKTREQVEQEVHEDVQLWHDGFIATWREVCKSRKATRQKRAWRRMKWALWDKKMQELWQKDQEWRVRWQHTVLEKVLAQAEVPKEALTKRIVKRKEELGCFLRLPEESEAAYEERLRRKGYKFWKEEKKAEAERRAAETKTDSSWDEPTPRWREFELHLRFGRRWRNIRLKNKELQKARHRLGVLEEERRKMLAVAQAGISQLGSSVKCPTTAPEEAINGSPNKETHTPKGQRDGQPTARPPVPHVDEPQEHSPGRPPDTQVNGVAGSSTSQKPDTDVSDTTNETTIQDDAPDEVYLRILTERFMEKFMADPKKGLQEPEHSFSRKDSEDIQRLKQNWCYYEVLGESYLHGMMDGEAMAYQNENGIKALVFELR